MEHIEVVLGRIDPNETPLTNQTQSTPLRLRAATKAHTWTCSPPWPILDAHPLPATWDLGG